MKESSKAMLAASPTTAIATAPATYACEPTVRDIHALPAKLARAKHRFNITRYFITLVTNATSLLTTAHYAAGVSVQFFLFVVFLFVVFVFVVFVFDVFVFSALVMAIK